MRANDIPKFDELTISEKLLLAEDIWENIQSDPSGIPIPESHKKELDKRMESYVAHPGNILSLEELKSNIESRK